MTSRPSRTSRSSPCPSRHPCCRHLSREGWRPTSPASRTSVTRSCRSDSIALHRPSPRILHRGRSTNRAWSGWPTEERRSCSCASDSVERPAQPNDFAPLPMATVTTAGGDAFDLLLPDPGVQRLLGDPALLADPVRAGQAVLGELATIWREQPVPGLQPDGTETIRGVAMTMPATLPADTWAPLVRRLSEASFLRPSHATEFAEQVNPVQLRRRHRAVAGTVPTRLRRCDPQPAPQRLRLPIHARGTERPPRPARPQPDVRRGRGVRERPHRRSALVRPGERCHGLDLPRRAARRATDLPAHLRARARSRLRMGNPGPTPLTVQVVLRSASFEFPGRCPAAR